jgi:hypothetical protein
MCACISSRGCKGVHALYCHQACRACVHRTTTDHNSLRRLQHVEPVEDKCPGISACALQQSVHLTMLNAWTLALQAAVTARIVITCGPEQLLMRR